MPTCPKHEKYNVKVGCFFPEKKEKIGGGWGGWYIKVDHDGSNFVCHLILEVVSAQCG